MKARKKYQVKVDGVWLDTTHAVTTPNGWLFSKATDGEARRSPPKLWRIKPKEKASA